MAVSRRWRFGVVGAIIVVGAPLWTVEHYHLFDRSTSTPISIQQARDRYRDLTSTTQPAAVVTPPTAPASTSPASTSSTSSTSTSSTSTTVAPVDARLPPLGVYVYTITGGDAVDALSGAHHDYPATTTITVTASDCGVRQRWDVLVERWEEWVRCVDGDAVVQPARTTSDQFFGQTQTDAYTCTGDSRPVDAPAGTSWVTTCVQGDKDHDVYTGEVVGTETSTVGGVDVQTLHVRVTIANGTASDSQVIDTWYQVGTDLVIAQTAQAATTNPSPIGSVHYNENYEIRLTSLSPLT